MPREGGGVVDLTLRVAGSGSGTVAARVLVVDDHHG